MMSGRLASAIEAYDNAAEFRASIPTMAHYLRHLDYQTTLCGKMHFVGPDLLHGFEERLTPEIYSSDFMTLPDWSESERDDYASDAYEALCEAGPAPRTVQMDYDEEVAFQAKRKLYDLARTDDPRSFLLVVSFTHPHDPYICRQEFWDLFPDAEIDMPRVGRFAESDLDPHSRRIYRHYICPGRRSPTTMSEGRGGPTTDRWPTWIVTWGSCSTWLVKPVSWTTPSSSSPPTMATCWVNAACGSRRCCSRTRCGCR